MISLEYIGVFPFFFHVRLYLGTDNLADGIYIAMLEEHTYIFLFSNLEFIKDAKTIYAMTEPIKK